MQQASILLSLGADSGNQVPKFGVTPAEVAILLAIHGDGSVNEIDIMDEDADRTNNGEMVRLNELYRGARIDDGNGSSRKVVDALFPGIGAKLPTSFDDLPNLDKSAFKAEKTAEQKKVAKARAKKVEAGEDADPIPGTVPAAVKTSALD